MLDFLLHTKEGLVVLGVALGIVACAMPRWHTVFFALLAIPLLGFTLGMFGMFARPPEDQTPVSMLEPLIAALWPAAGALGVAVPLLFLRRVGEMIFPKRRPNASEDSRG